jgi:predicted dehydrogenase
VSHAVAVLGLGSIGLRHARNLLALGCRVTGFDPDAARRAMLAAEGGAVVAERDAALHGCVAAVIASPSRHHAADLAAVIGAGLHAFVEKPLSHTGAGIAGTVAKAEAEGRQVFAGLMLRWHPCVERARTAIGQGALGEILWARSTFGSWLPDWRPQTDYRKGYAADPQTGGVLFDLIHEFDLLHHLLGPAQAACAAARRSGRLEMASEDIAEVVLRHQSGVLSSLHVDYLTQPAVRRVEIAGTGGLLQLDLNARQFRRCDPAGAVVEDVVLPGSYADDYVAEMRDFIACIEGRMAPRCGGAEAVAVLETVIAARRLCGLPHSGEEK